MFGQVICTEPDLRYLMTGVILIIGLALIIRWTGLGRNIMALASNRLLYLSLGKNELRLLLVVYGISGGIAGLCGAYEGLRNGVDPYGCLPFAITAAVAALLGARNFLMGPIAAGVGLGLVRSLTIQFISNAWSDFVVYGLLLILLSINPTRLLGPAVEEERP
jgi:branched-subunit amino acid ABC-type transport system permease component